MTLSSRPLAVVAAQPFYKYASQGSNMDKSTTTKRGGQQPFGDLTPYNNNNYSNYYCGGDYRREEEPAGWPHHYVKKENSENHHVMIKSNKGSTKEGFHVSWDRSYPTAPYYYKHNSAHNNSSNNNVLMPRGGKYYQQERTASQYYVPTTSTEPYDGNPYYDRASTPSSCCYQQYMDNNENRLTTKLSSGYSAYHTSYPTTTKPFAHQPTRPTEKLHQALTSASSEDNRRPIGSTTSYHHHNDKTNNMCFPHPLPVSDNNDKKKNNDAVGNNNNDDDETALQSLDIVCGRGAPKNFHYGNQVFLELVKDYQTKYFCAKRSDKADIAMKILDIVKARGGRFVRRQKKAAGSSRSSSCWEPISDKNAYERVCQALRDGTPDLQRQVLSTLRSSSSSAKL